MASLQTRFSDLSIAAEKADNFTNLLLVGKTGEGKSSTANTIIGEKRFHSSARSSSDTKKYQREVVRAQGQAILVVDSPGLADTDMRTDEGLEQLETEVHNILAIQPDGFDAILIVTKFGKRLTAEDCQVFEQLERFFGKDFVRDFGILLVSCADTYDPKENNHFPIEVCLFSDTGPMQDMLEKCNNRLICFNNRTEDESVRHDQVKRLLDLVAEMKQNSQRYTPEIFLIAQRERDEAILKSKEPIIRDKTEKSLRLITEDLEKVPRDLASIERLIALKANLGKHLEELIQQDKGTNILEGLIARVKSLENRIDGLMEDIVNMNEMKDEADKIVREERERREKWEREERARQKEAEERAEREAEEKARQDAAKWEEIERVRREEMERANIEKAEILQILRDDRERYETERKEEMKKAEEERKQWMKYVQDERKRVEEEVRERFNDMDRARREEMERFTKMCQQRENGLQNDVKGIKEELDNSFMHHVGGVFKSLASGVGEGVGRAGKAVSRVGKAIRGLFTGD